MTVKDLIIELLNFPMDSRVDILVNFGNEFLKEFDIEAGEEIYDWYEISGIDTTNYSGGRKDVSIYIKS